MIERANQVDPVGPAQPERGTAPPADGGRSGVRYALVGILIVLAWLLLCMFLRRVF